MPNDCWNVMTVYADSEELNTFMSEEFKDVPSWALKIKIRGQGAVQFSLWSPWAPRFEWLEELLDRYPSMWIKNLWDEEGGAAGVWIGYIKEGRKSIQTLDWNEGCIEEQCWRFRDADGNVPLVDPDAPAAPAAPAGH